MPLTNTARDMLSDAIIGGSTFDKLDATNAHIGVGDSSTAFAATQTDLQASTNKLRKVVDGAPTRTANELTFVATFGADDANFAWAEWGLFNHLTAGQMYSRLVEANGTKANPAVWEFTVTSTITLS